MTRAVVAVDLGATNGRVVLGRFDGETVHLSTVHRFPNVPVETPDGLHWNILELYHHVIEGLAAAVRGEPDISSVGVDAWAVDYALIHEGRMLGTPFHYRDRRCEVGVQTVSAQISKEELYARNGLQHLPFNTVFQLVTESSLMLQADAMLLIPDLIAHWLCGQQVCEATNASTTGLVDVHTGRWDTNLMELLGLPTRIFRTLTPPGTTVDALRTCVMEQIGATSSVSVTTVGSHDTASAVVGVPMASQGAAYISCGTWALVGVELEHPVITDESREANFTNEAGVDGRTRFLRNVMGLWLLSESIRHWQMAGEVVDLPALIRQAGEVSGVVSTFDANDERFFAPGDIPTRIMEYFEERGVCSPAGRPAIVRSILASLAKAFGEAVQRASELSGHKVMVVHLVGGGAQNELLCQLTADQCGLPILAGPVEATALGNILVQARAEGFVNGDLDRLRTLAFSAQQAIRYSPRSKRETPE